MSLMDELNRISDGISQKIKSATNESRTRSYLVDPFIGALGYNVNDPRDVVHEYTADIGKQGEKVDYAIKRDGKLILFVEVKSATIGLSDKHTAQLRRYFGTKSQVRFGILTNGFEYRFYADLDNPNIMDDKPFATIDLRLFDEKQVNELNIFTKSAFNLERALAMARTLKYTLTFRQLLNVELNPLSEQLIEYFSRKIYKGRMRKSVINEFAPLVRKAFDEFVDDKIASRPPTVIAEPAPIEPEVKETPAISDTGQFVEIPIYLRYKRKRHHDATLLFNGSNSRKWRIRLEEEILSVTDAALKAVHSINPGVKAVSASWLWKLTDPDGNKERHIGDLRKDEGLRRRLLGTD